MFMSSILQGPPFGRGDIRVVEMTGKVNFDLIGILPTRKPADVFFRQQRPLQTGVRPCPIGPIVVLLCKVFGGEVYMGVFLNSQ